MQQDAKGLNFGLPCCIWLLIYNGRNAQLQELSSRQMESAP